MIEHDQKMPSSFRWLNATQFFGALNDNIFKLFVMYALIGMHGQDAGSMVTGVAGAVFVIPFLLFAILAGVIADRFSKRNVVVAVKISELVIMTLSVAAFASGQGWALYVVLFLMATQSAIFGPSKFGIVPEIVGRERLSRANGFIQAFTYLAIILGTGLASAVGQAAGGNYGRAAVVCVFVAVAGLLASFRIGRTEAVAPASKLSLKALWHTVRVIRSDAYLTMAVLFSAYFLLIGAFMQLNIIPYGMEVLGLSKEASGLLFLLAAVGIGIGSMASGKLSGRGIEFGIVPVGALGLTLANILLYFVHPSVYTVGALILLAGLSAGLFIVPVQAFIQFRSPPEKLGEILAASSFLSWTGVLVASGLLILFPLVGIGPAAGFTIIGATTLVLTVVTFRILPDFFVRFLALLLARVVYRIRVLHRGNLPVDGPALMVSNHAAWSDAFILLATTQRRVQFLMSRHMYERSGWVKPLFRLAGVIPILFSDPPKKLAASLDRARERLDAGYLVCVFAEGSLTRTGMMRQFRSGFRHVLKGTEYPILPVYIGGAWGSWLSHYRGKVAHRFPERIPYPVSVVFGEALPTDTPVDRVREAVQELSCVYFEDRKRSCRPLAEDFVRSARRHWSRRAIKDTTGRDLTFGRTLIASLLLSDKISEVTGETDHVAVLLPQSVAGVCVNFALGLSGKVSVNLNYSASVASLSSALDQCGARHIITSRKFLEKVSIEGLPGEMLYAEDLFAGFSKGDKLRALLKARCWPRRALVPGRGFTGDAPATVIFSSGSTGEPKGVVLSHYNIQANVEAANMLMRVQSETDVFCGTLPLFHAFGYTATMWFPLLHGVMVSYHPNPLEAARVAQLVREDQCTVMVATPAFLVAYMRRAKPDDFRSLRFCIAGAEKLKQKTADAFHRRFGILPMEGYGATELSPIASINLPDATIDGVSQVGHKPGSAGHPLPGVAARIVDPATGERLATGEEGLMLIKGPNVMQGYLGKPELTAEVMRDGWYVTGDIARIDKDGFITITDRLSRFSKIGGEMVPHGAVEDVLLDGIESEGRAVAVTSVKDERRGERLVVVHTPEAGTVDDLKDILAHSELPNLWKPRPADYVEVPELPLLGSGKLDLKHLRELAGKTSDEGMEG